MLRVVPKMDPPVRLGARAGGGEQTFPTASAQHWRGPIDKQTLLRHCGRVAGAGCYLLDQFWKGFGAGAFLLQPWHSHA